MREINVHEVTETVGDLCIAANHELGIDVLDAFERAIAQEESPVDTGFCVHVCPK
jgi:fumarate hydratase subunit alpha